MKKVIVVAVIAACVQATRFACGCNEGNRAIEQRQKMERPREPTKVKLGPTRLQYFEGENTLVLFTEAARDREGFYYIVYVPTPEHQTPDEGRTYQVGGPRVTGFWDPDSR